MEKEGGSLVDRPRSISAGETLSGGMRMLITGAGDRFKKLRRCVYFKPLRVWVRINFAAVSGTIALFMQAFRHMLRKRMSQRRCSTQRYLFSIFSRTPRTIRCTQSGMFMWNIMIYQTFQLTYFFFFHKRTGMQLQWFFQWRTANRFLPPVKIPKSFKSTNATILSDVLCFQVPG